MVRRGPVSQRSLGDWRCDCTSVTWIPGPCTGRRRSRCWPHKLTWVTVRPLWRRVSAIDLQVSTDPQHVETWLDGRRVDAEIRSDAVTAAVSAVSAVAAVRTQLVAVQRSLIGAGGVVVEGRDIGTVVWPSARPKVYLTAAVEVRAQRRASEIGSHALTEVAASIARRDESDSGRAASPLMRADDAVELDTTYLSIDEVVQRLVDMTIAEMADS